MSALGTLGHAAEMVEWPELGVRAAQGFRVTLHADQELADDIYAMTLDSKGRAVVTSQGYIKTLQDTNADGRADEFKLFAATKTGGMGLCFQGQTLYFVGDGFFSRYRDADGDGVADGPPEKLIPLRFGEHGGHAPRKGPDGWWYLVGGNDSGIQSGHATLTNSPISWPEAGALLRISPDGKTSAIIADGLRNPYDFDFNAYGDIFTYDSDVERDFFLPWYTPTRIYHLSYGNHHGWRLPGYQRSWNRPDYYSDTVDILAPMGRGSPTGVACYRHQRFPVHYQQGLFACDWTFGKVYFLPLQQTGSTYQTSAEIFLEPIGTHGFAPTDVVVTPDGALLIAIGGRKTRGAVYRIEPLAPKTVPNEPVSELAFVLQSPQPLDAWSRARWEPIAKRLGTLPFCQVVLNESLDPIARIRAIEIVTELFNGLPEMTARKAAASKSSAVRARIAWSLGKMPYRQCGKILLNLALDLDSAVRCSALNAAIDQPAQVENNALVEVVLANFAHPDKRVRQAASRLASALREPRWDLMWGNLQNESLQTQLSGALAAIWRNAADKLSDIQNIAATVLEKTDDPGLLLQALRLIELAAGDYRLNDPSVEVYTGYEPARPLTSDDPLRIHSLKPVRQIFPSRDSRVNLEASRLLGMFRDEAPETIARVSSFLTVKSSATSDFHYLTVLSRLGGTWPEGLESKIADIILGLDTKLASQENRPKQNWTLRLVEVTSNLLQRNSGLAKSLLGHPQFVSSNHLDLARAFNPGDLETAARLYLSAAQAQPAFPWSPALVRLLSILPSAEIRPLLRKRWDQTELQGPILDELSRHPLEMDRSKFLQGLSSGNPATIGNCLEALMRLPRDPSPEFLVALVELVERLDRDGQPQGLLTSGLLLFNREAGQNFAAASRPGELKSAGELSKAVRQWFEQAYPSKSQRRNPREEDNWEHWERILKTASGLKGDSERGHSLFTARGCQTCHQGSTALGPDLAGAAKRLSPEDLLKSIVDPNRDVAPAYQATLFKTRDGQNYKGLVAFESADGVILRTTPDLTVRLAESEIVSRTLTPESVMPTGLLKDLAPQDLSDLLAYLQILH